MRPARKGSRENAGDGKGIREIRQGHEFRESSRIKKGRDGLFAFVSRLPPARFLSPRRRSGERIEERGFPEKNVPPLPVPLLHPMEERVNHRLPGRFETVS
jgi:hypothetical protein